MQNCDTHLCISRARPEAKRIVQLLAAVLGLAVSSAGAVTLSPSVAQLTLTQGNTVSQRVTASQGSVEGCETYEIGDVEFPTTLVGTLEWKWATDDSHWTYVDGQPLATYSYTDPGTLQHCDALNSRIDVDGVCRYEIDAYDYSLGTASSTVSVRYQDPLTVSENTQEFSAAPGEPVNFSASFSGGRGPYTATSSLGASVEIQGSTLSYAYVIPGNAAANLTDTITLSGESTECGGDSATITVTINVLPELAVSPAALSLPGDPGDTVEGTLTVSGGVPGYSASANLGDASISGDTITYRYPIPSDASAGTIDAAITITDSAENPQSITVPVQITVSVPITPTLSASPSPLVLRPGSPGETVEGTLAVSGGVPGYAASAKVGDASTSGNTVTYRYPIPSDASEGTIDAAITITDSAQNPQSITVPVKITVSSVPVAPPIAVTPSPLELSALSLVGVEGEAAKSFDVSGGTPPYSLSVASGGSGTVEPARLDAAGSATYAVAIPASSAAAVISDRIMITDSSGARVEVPVTVKVGASDSLSSRADLTENERNVGHAIETICPQLALMTERTAQQEDLFQQCSEMLENASSSGIPNTLEEVTTEEANAASGAAVEIGNQQLANIGSRLAALRRGATGLSLQGLTLNVDGQAVPAEQIASLLSLQKSGGAASGDSPFGRWGFFINGSFNFGDKDTTDNETGFDFSAAGVTAGADYRFTEKLIAGGAVGYGRSDVSFDSSGGGLDTETWHLAAYGNYSWTDRVYVDAVVEYGWHDYNSSRNILYRVSSTTSAVNRQADANYDGNQFGASIGAGYDFDEGPLSYGVYGRAGYIQVDVDGYQETGADGLNLRIDGFDATSVTTTLGTRISRVFNTNRAVLVPQARAEWEHEYDQDADTLVARFVADPTNTAFGIVTDSPDRDYFRIGLGLSAVFPHGISAFVNYDTLLDKQDWTDHLIDVGLRWELY